MLEQQKINLTQIAYSFVFRMGKSAKIYSNYFSQLCPTGRYVRELTCNIEGNEELLITRTEHICQKQDEQQSSQQMKQKSQIANSNDMCNNKSSSVEFDKVITQIIAQANNKADSQIGVNANKENFDAIMNLPHSINFMRSISITKSEFTNMALLNDLK